MKLYGNLPYFTTETGVFMQNGEFVVRLFACGGRFHGLDVYFHKLFYSQGNQIIQMFLPGENTITVKTDGRNGEL